MIGLIPAEVASIDRERRIVKIRIPGLTDGATDLPEAQLCLPIGDKSEHTEIRILPDDRVWIAFEGGDTRYPVIVGYRPRNQENGIDWRRFAHANFQFNADSTFEIIAGTAIRLVSPLIKIVGDIEHTGTMTSTGDHVAGGVSVIDHKHGGVKAGGDSTGTPI